jgi:hypothetical protein
MAVVQLPSGLLAQVSVSPSSSGMPGGALIQQLLGWLDQVALWGALAGVVGACLAGLAPTVVNLLFHAAGG